MSLLTTVNGRGTLAARPAAAAANEGYIYSASDASLYRSNGTSWDTIASTGLADQGTFTFLDGTVAAAPATPAAGKLRMYAKTGKVLAVKDDAGLETVLGAGGGYVSGELDYVAFTAPVNITATTEGTADTVVTGSAVTYDGSTIVLIEFFCPFLTVPASVGNDTIFCLYDGASSIGFFGLISTISSATTQRLSNPHLARRLTPSAASHTYSVRAYVGSGTAVAGAGAGGAAAHVPGFIRIRRA